MLFDIILSFLNGGDLFCILIRNLQFKLFFKRHDEFDQIKRVCVKILNERSGRNDLTLVNTKLINNNLLESVMYRWSGHYFTSLSALEMGCCCARLNIVPRTPLIKRLEVSLPKVLASSTASLIAALAGTVLLNRISYIASLRIFLSMRAICCRG